ncbi:MAG: hypothetical protein AB8G11_11940 [Saprospiraceae bacterium]
MKKLLLTISLICSITLSYGQDRIAINLNTGNNITYYLRGHLNFPEENSYLWGFIGYYNDVNFASSLGVTYETKTFNVLEETMYLATQTNLSYRAFGQDRFLKQFLFSNDIYFPKRVKDNRLRWFAGIRNTFVIFDSTNDIDTGFEQYKYQFGLTTLLDYKINDKWSVGMNAYVSTRKLSNNRTLTRIHTAEALLKISYKIK